MMPSNDAPLCAQSYFLRKKVLIEIHCVHGEALAVLGEKRR